MLVSTERSGDQEVLEPVFMVTVLVEAFGRDLPTVVVFSRVRMPWSEVVEQRPCPTVLVAGLAGAVQMSAAASVSSSLVMRMPRGSYRV